MFVVVCCVLMQGVVVVVVVVLLGVAIQNASIVVVRCHFGPPAGPLGRATGRMCCGFCFGALCCVIDACLLLVLPLCACVCALRVCVCVCVIASCLLLCCLALCSALSWCVVSVMCLFLSVFVIDLKHDTYPGVCLSMSFFMMVTGYFEIVPLKTLWIHSLHVWMSMFHALIDFVPNPSSLRWKSIVHGPPCNVGLQEFHQEVLHRGSDHGSPLAVRSSGWVFTVTTEA